MCNAVYTKKSNIWNLGGDKITRKLGLNIFLNSIVRQVLMSRSIRKYRSCNVPNTDKMLYFIFSTVILIRNLNRSDGTFY